MSLIQEALKRQQEDMDGSAGVAPHTPPNTPSPAPQDAPRIARKVQTSSPAHDDAEPPPVQLPTQLESDEAASTAAGDDGDASLNAGAAPAPLSGDSSKPGLKVILLIVGVILGLAFGVWTIIFAIQTWSKPKPAAGAESPAAADPAATTQPGVNGPAPQTPVVDVPPVVEPGTPPAIDSVAAPQAVQPAAEPEPVAWPLLTINGLVGKGAQGAAMINSQIVGVNETIEGAKVIEIQKLGVTLEFEGEKKFVPVGASTQ